jgi:hypothetical protein
MTLAAWAVVLVSVLAVGGGALVVIQLAPPAGGVTAVEAAPVEGAEVRAPAPIETAEQRSPEPRQSPSWLGIVLPAAIFLFATIVTAALHRHFSRVEAHG